MTINELYNASSEQYKKFHEYLLEEHDIEAVLYDGVRWEFQIFDSTDMCVSFVAHHIIKYLWLQRYGKVDVDTELNRWMWKL